MTRFLVLHCRIGNLLMPDQNYQLLENWLIPIMGQMLLEQNTQVQFILID